MRIVFFIFILLSCPKQKQSYKNNWQKEYHSNGNQNKVKLSFLVDCRMVYALFLKYTILNYFSNQ